MFAVGIDVSNGWSTAAVFQTKTNMIIKPFEFNHTTDGFASFSERLKGLGGEIKIVMECTGRYYESVAMNLHNAGFFVSAVNPIAIKRYQDGVKVRVVKTDKADAKKLARFALDNWELLPRFTPMDAIRYNLKTLNRQFQLSSKMRRKRTRTKKHTLLPFPLTIKIPSSISVCPQASSKRSPTVAWTQSLI